MFEASRFEAADQLLEKVAEAYAHAPGLAGVISGRAPETADRNPAGPQFQVIVEDPAKLADDRANGRLPTEIDTGEDIVEIAVIRGSAAEHAHTVHEPNPIPPGSSVSDNRIDAGTIGAVVQSPGGGDHFITCGHVVRTGRGALVYQAGNFDAKKNGDKIRKVGTVVRSAFRSGTHDAALCKMSPGFTLRVTPHDGVPAPSASTPAAGMHRGVLAGASFMMDIDGCLASVGATMRHTTRVSNLDKGAVVHASGRTSGYIKGKVEFRAIFTGKGPATPGFIISPAGVTQPGDSGAVCVLQRSGETVVQEDGEDLTIFAEDEDTASETLTGHSKKLDAFINSRGKGVKGPTGTSLSGAAKQAIVSRILAGLEALSPLKVSVSSAGYKVACTPREKTRLRAEPVKEIILRKDREAEIPDLKYPEKDPEGRGECCSFGLAPYVVVRGQNGKDVVEAQFSVDVTGIGSINVKATLSQYLTGAKFSRYGQCYLGHCDGEELRGSVFVEREIELTLTISAGSIELPGLGKIEAGTAGITLKLNPVLEKKFKLGCSAR